MRHQHDRAPARPGGQRVVSCADSTPDKGWSFCGTNRRESKNEILDLILDSVKFSFMRSAGRCTSRKKGETSMRKQDPGSDELEVNRGSWSDAVSPLLSGSWHLPAERMKGNYDGIENEIGYFVLDSLRGPAKTPPSLSGWNHSRYNTLPRLVRRAPCHFGAAWPQRKTPANGFNFRRQGACRTLTQTLLNGT